MTKSCAMPQAMNIGEYMKALIEGLTVAKHIFSLRYSRHMPQTGCLTIPQQPNAKAYICTSRLADISPQFSRVVTKLRKPARSCPPVRLDWV